MVKLRVSLRIKFILIFLATIMLVTVLTGYLSYTKAADDLDVQIGKQAMHVAITGAMTINGDDIAKIKKAEDEKKPEYKKAYDLLTKMNKENNLFYSWIFVPINSEYDTMNIVDTTEGEEHWTPGIVYDLSTEMPDVNDRNESIKRTKESFEEGKPTYIKGVYTDEWGSYKAGFAPIKNSKGEVVAVLEVDFAADDVITAQKALFNRYLIAGGIGLFISIILSVLFGTYFTSPIRKMLTTMSEIADMNGDLTQEIKVKSTDEIGQLAGQFNRMLSNLRALIKQMQANISEVAITSGELLKTADESEKATEQIVTAINSTIIAVEEGSNRQRESVEKAIAAMEQFNAALVQAATGATQQAEQVNQASMYVGEIAGEIEQVAQSSSTMADSTGKTTEAAKTGKKVIQDTIHGMEVVRDIVQEAASTIQELGSRSKQIGEIIQVIDDIAEQTNLLALNAAIEAARAGEHGKGFAVVADEVRKLAERSSRSTKEIGDLINVITREIEKSVSAMDKGTIEVGQGFAKAEEAGQALAQIYDLAEDASVQTKYINDSTAKVADKSRHMVSSTDTVASIVQENSAAISQMSASSGDIKKTVENIGYVSAQSAQAIKEVAASGEGMRNVVKNIAVSSKNLARMADDLKAMTVQFKVD